MEYFKREIVNNIVIEKVNLSNITFIEAKVFWERIQKDIHSGYVYIIIDLSCCSLIDQTFINIIFNTYRILCPRNGKINIVLPSLGTIDLYKITALSNFVGMTHSVQTAIEQINLKDSASLEVASNRLRN